MAGLGAWYPRVDGGCPYLMSDRLPRAQTGPQLPVVEVAGVGKVSRVGSSGPGWRAHCRGTAGCRLPRRLLLPGEAAPGSIFASAGCGCKSDGIKMFVLIWQRQPWDISRQCFAGKKENENTLHQNYYSAVPWSQQPASCEGSFLVCLFSLSAGVLMALSAAVATRHVGTVPPACLAHAGSLQSTRLC